MVRARVSIFPNLCGVLGHHRRNEAVLRHARRGLVVRELVNRVLQLRHVDPAEATELPRKLLHGERRRSSITPSHARGFLVRHAALFRDLRRGLDMFHLGHRDVRLRVGRSVRSQF